MDKELFNATVERFHDYPIYKELDKIKKRIDTTDDMIEMLELEDDLMVIKEFSIKLIQDVKDGKEFAFDTLMSIKDMRNFLYHYAYHIAKHHKFKYKENDILHEIRHQIFYHIKKNYRLYNEPHEIGLLIMSMRGWIKQKVSNSLKPFYHPKTDSYLKQFFLDSGEGNISDVYVNDILTKCLTKEEYEVYVLRVEQNYRLYEIGELMGYSKDTAKRRYQRAIEKLKKELEGADE